MVAQVGTVLGQAASSFLLCFAFFCGRKTLNQPEKLERGLGLVEATSLNMTFMVGIGPFVVIPFIVQSMRGPQCLLAWLAGAATSNHQIPPVTVVQQTAIEKRGAELAAVFAEHDRVLGGGLVVSGRGPQPDDAQMAMPVADQVADGRPDVGERGVLVAERLLPLDQPGERLLGDVLGIIGAQQIGKPDQLRVPGLEQGAHRYRPGLRSRGLPYICHVH